MKLLIIILLKNKNSDLNYRKPHCPGFEVKGGFAFNG